MTDLNSSETKEIYCNSHVPKLTKGNLDQEALGIRAALDAQARAGNKVIIQNWLFNEP